ncbi:MAG: diguanylate cyclase [Chromatiaceae bacterium]|nr:diguanylate cyclase [Chromatiaceae bacterium]MCF7995924.1 diguanylate cyclase [Chromatiaceae bacterium]MCF8017747.1 diguanylate cyclase [Chromatiaceae bacterium]
MLSFFLSRRRSPLALRLLITILVTSSLITLLAVALQLYVEYRSDVELIEQRLNQIQGSYSDSVALCVWNFDRKQFNSQLEGILHFPDIVYAEIRGEDGELIAARGTPQDKGFIRKEIALSTTDFGRSVQPGRLVIVASLERVYNNLFQRGLIILVTQGIKTLIVSIVILLAFHWMVTRHLYRIGTYARQIDLGSEQRLQMQRAPGTNDELDFIAHAINDMQDNLQHSYRTIAELNQSLEHKVEQRTRALQASTEKFRYLFQNALESIGIFDQEHCVDLNKAGLELFGFSSLAQAQGLHALDFVAPESMAIVREKIARQDAEPYEAIGRKRDGSQFPMLVKGQNALIDGKPTRITSAIDLTEIKRSEAALRQANQELARIAHTDPLTGAFNRRYLDEAATSLLALAKREGRDIAIAMMDIDDFKPINDRFGHDMGDRVIAVLVDLIRQQIRQSDLIVRFGGEEFVLMLPNTGLEDAEHVAEKIRQQVATSQAAAPVQFTLSIGLTVVSSLDQTISDSIARADKALYQAKREGKNRVCSKPTSEPLSRAAPSRFGHHE